MIPFALIWLSNNTFQSEKGELRKWGQESQCSHPIETISVHKHVGKNDNEIAS